jgi:hypothetical protein
MKATVALLVLFCSVSCALGRSFETEIETAVSPTASVQYSWLRIKQ